MLDSNNAKPDPVRAKAWRLFVRSYDLPEYYTPELTPAALDDLTSAAAGRRVPAWALSLLTGDEVRKL